jgi:opacity protein-like surface antigen
MKVGFTKTRVLSCLLAIVPCVTTALVVDQPSVDPYGNAQSTAFQKAITGGSTIRLEEQAALNAMVPKRTDQRFYGSVRYNSGPFALTSFRNKSTDDNKTGIVSTKSVSAKQSSFSLLLGYQFSNAFRADLEYLSRKTLSYTASPVLTGTGIIARKLEGTLKGSTVFMNGYYDFSNQTPFIPYLSGGVGLSKYTLTASLSPAPTAGASKSNSPIKPAMAVGAGLKMRIFGDHFVDLSYRYMQLGANLQFRANSGFMMDASHSAKVMSVGWIHVF